MSFIKYNRVHGNLYASLVESYRPSYGSTPRHRFIKYLGSVNSFSSKFIEPMRPSSLEEIPKNIKDYSIELKEDGSRAIGYFSKKDQAFINRRNVNKTEIYPELRDIHKKLRFKKNAVLDGEIVALKNGKSDFKTLSERDRLKDKELIRIRSKTHPLEYHVFDILELDGKDLKKLSLKERKKILDQVVPDNLKEVKEIRSKPFKQLLKEAKKKKEEGIILKKLDSPYEEGKLSKNWKKLKLLKENDIVILGFSEGTGKRKGLFGAILTGVYDQKSGKYRFTGKAGSGFNDEQLKEFKNKFDKLKLKKQPDIINLPKEKNVTFIKPELVARIRFLQLTKDNIMREGRFVTLRTDIDPKDTNLRPQEFRLPKKALASLSGKIIEIEKKGRIVKTRDPKDVLKIAKTVERDLKKYSSKLSLAGSIRRKKPATDVDLVLIPKNKEKIKQYLSEKGMVESSGEKKMSSIINGVKVDVYFADKKTFPASLFFLTGPTGANIHHRRIAKENGWLLNQYGLFDRKTKRPIAFRSEKEIYESLGSTFRKPELRGLPR